MADSPLRPSQLPEPDGKGVHDWAMLALQEGEAFLQRQDGYDKIPEIIRAIMGTTYEDKLRPSSISAMQLNHAGRVGLDLASSLTDIKPFWEYRTSNPLFEQQATIANKLGENWWTGPRLIDLKFCDVIKFGLAGGSGYAHQVYDPELRDMDLISEDPRDVLPIRPSDMYSVQNCFGIIIKRERPVNYLRAKYPQYANYIKPDRDGSFSAVNKQMTAAKLVEGLGLSSGFMNNLWSAIGGRPNAAPLNVPVADLFTIYVKDDSLNMTGEKKIIGDPATNWSYIVKPGQPWYPRGRVITLVRSCKVPLYDGPNIYWHGLFPLPKLTLDPWPWSWLGKSPMKDLLTIQKEIDRTCRGINDKFEKFWRPDLVTDSKTWAKSKADRIDTRRAGLRVRTDMSTGSAGFSMPEPNPASIQMGMAWLQFLIQEMKELSGTQELTSLVQLGQIPASETIERLTESFSPAIRLRSRVIEAFMREFAMITLSNMFQFRTVSQRIAELGPSGLTFEDADLDPDSLIPDMIRMGYKDADGNPLPIDQRAKVFLDNFTYHIAPGSLLSASEVTDKLMYLQLTRMGIMDPVTLLEKLKVPNLGLPPEFPNGILQRLQAMQQMGIGLAPGPASGGGKGGGAGRPASGQAMPRMTVKES